MRPMPIQPIFNAVFVAILELLVPNPVAAGLLA